MLFKKLASLALLAAAVTAQVPKGKAFDHIFIVFLENTVRSTTSSSLFCYAFEFSPGSNCTFNLSNPRQY